MSTQGVLYQKINGSLVEADIKHTHTAFAITHSYTTAANAAKNWYRIANASTQQLDVSKPIHAQFILTAYNASYDAGYYERWFINAEVFGRNAHIIIFGNHSAPFSQARILYENTVADLDANDRPAIDIYLNYQLANGTTKIEIEEVYNNGGWTFVTDGQLAASSVPSGFENIASAPRNNGVNNSAFADYVPYLNRQISNITAAFTLADTSTYRSRTLNCTGTFTITIPSINSGYMWCVIKNKNTSSGVITLHPSTTSVLIDGSNADITLQPMEYVCIHSAGANNYSLIADGRWKSQKADKATTLAGYGITDAKIANGTITLGSSSITPLTSHLTVDSALSSTSTNPVQNKVINTALSGKAASNHTHTYITSGSDTRNVATVPTDYSAKLSFPGLKTKATAGNPSNDTYSYIIGLMGWGDVSGGNAHELAFNNSGINHRIGTNATTWGTWKTIAYKETTLAGYGITDAKIVNGTITLGSNSITPLTSHQTVDSATSTTSTNPVQNKVITQRTVEFIKGTQTAATGTWTGVTADNALYDGKCIKYLLPYAGSGNATLNLTLAGGTTTGAIECWYNGGSRLTTHFGANQIIGMTYIASSNRWQVDADYNTDSTSINYYTYYNPGGTSNYEVASPANYRFYARSTTSKYIPITKGTSFDLRYQIFYRASGDARYIGGGFTADINTVLGVTGISLTANEPVYFKGTLDGTVYTVDSTTPIVQTLPSSEDGKIYLYFGIAQNATVGSFTLFDLRLFAYRNGKIGLPEPSAITDSVINALS